MIAKVTYVCCGCRRTVRRYQFTDHPSCPSCGKEMTDIGYRWRVPKRTDDKGWHEVWERFCCKNAHKVAHTPGAVLSRRYARQKPHVAKEDTPSRREIYRKWADVFHDNP